MDSSGMKFSEIGILRAFIEYYGHKLYKRIWWNKIQGYGITATEFNGIAGCTRRIFSEKKKFLYENKMIKTLKSKERGTPYTITPFGICYYCSKISEVDSSIGISIFKLLSTYSTYHLELLWKEIFNVITNKDALFIFKRVCDSIAFSQTNDGSYVSLRYKSREGIIYEFTTYKLYQNQIRLILPENLRIIDNYNYEKTPTSSPTIDEKLFHQDIAEFLVQSFCYSIIEYYHFEILVSTITLNGKNLTNVEEMTLKNKITNWEDILAKLPLDVHLIAVHFIGDKIFGTIKNEQKLAKKISDHFYQKIAPNAGIEFVNKKGKPYSLFSPKNLKLE